MTRHRILVIDDHLDTAESLAQLFRTMGHEVQFAINGFAALTIASVFRPGIVFVDLRLPDFDGCELARRMKEGVGLRGSRFYAITGQAGRGERDRAMKAGCDELFLKPLDPKVLDSLLAA